MVASAGNFVIIIDKFMYWHFKVWVRGDGGWLVGLLICIVCLIQGMLGKCIMEGGMCMRVAMMV